MAARGGRCGGSFRFRGSFRELRLVAVVHRSFVPSRHFFPAIIFFLYLCEMKKRRFFFPLVLFVNRSGFFLAGRWWSIGGEMASHVRETRVFGDWIGLNESDGPRWWPVNLYLRGPTSKRPIKQRQH